MARPVRMRKTYTGDRTKLARLEEAVLKDPRLSDEKKTQVLDQIRQLVGLLMGLDSNLPPVPEGLARVERTERTGRKKVAAAVV